MPSFFTTFHLFHLVSHLSFLVSSVSSPLHNLSHVSFSSTVSPFPPHHFPLPCLHSNPVLPSPSRPVSSMWPDTSSRCWAQPLSCTGASRSRESSTPGRTRRTNTTGFCFAASKRAWKPNTHPPTDDAKNQSLVKSVFCWNDGHTFFSSEPDFALAAQNVLVFLWFLVMMAQ